MKNGIPVAIVGEPNVGKSTLLNALLNDNRAIVSEIAGTTRDTIEDEIIIEGMCFRFIDTAGIRDTKDSIETIGIEKTFEKINHAKVVLYLFDAATASYEKVSDQLKKLENHIKGKQLIVIANKIDQADASQIKSNFGDIEGLLFISAKLKENIQNLKTLLTDQVKKGILNNDDVIVSNSRHFEALSNSLSHIVQVQVGMENDISSELLAMDIRQSLYHL